MKRSNLIKGFALSLLLLFPTTVFADDLQDQFLKDLAEGLTARWAITDTTDTAGFTTEEEMEFEYSYLDAELSHIEQYKDETFSNERFELLAKTYLYGLDLQRNAVSYEKDYPAVYQTQWSAGYTTRAAALCDLYDYYGLDVDETNITEMRSVLIPEYEVVVSDVNDAQETASTSAIEITGVEATEQMGGYIELKYKVKNNTEATLTDLYLTIAELDANNDILATTYVVSNSPVEPGQSASLIGSVMSSERPVSLRLDEYSAFDETNNSYKTGKFEENEFKLCLLDDILSDKYAKTVQGASETDIEIYNNEGITVYLSGAERTEYGSTRIHVRVENLNHHNIFVGTSNYSTVINGKMVATSPWIEVKSGKTATENWDIYDTDLADAGIDKIENMSLAITIGDADTYYDLYSGNEVFINVGDDYTLTTRTVYTDTEHIRQVQELLNQLGYECGSADGIPGKKTNSCILEFERDHGLAESTEITQELIDALEEAAA